MSPVAMQICYDVRICDAGIFIALQGWQETWRKLAELQEGTEGREGSHSPGSPQLPVPGLQSGEMYWYIKTPKSQTKSQIGAAVDKVLPRSAT